MELAPLTGTLRASADAALGDGLAFVQSLIGYHHQTDADALVEGGFVRLAELMYMRRDLARPIESPKVQDMSWQSCKPMDHIALGRVITATYERSLDCPVLSGLREADDVLESHKASGIWRPDFWWIAKLGGVAAGCVLVNDSSTSPGDMDLVYMGVGAPFRGRRLGRAMVLRAMQQAKAAGRQFMHVVVDAANPYAKKIYEDEGFVLTHRRVAYIRR
ncbi:MAG: GNAT family N-acetyltransferase [Alphaproteobacteria bacterium]